MELNKENLDTTGITNVHLCKKSGKYRARVRFLGKSYYSTLFDTPEQAGIAAKRMRQEFKEKAIGL